MMELQRRFSCCGRRAALAARGRRPRLTGQGRVRKSLRAVRRRQHDAWRSRSRCRTVAGHMIARLSLEPGSISTAAAQATSHVRRRRDRSGQLLYEPDADLSRARRARSDPAGEGACGSGVEPAHRRARHVAFTAGEAIREMGALIGRPIDVALISTSRPSEETWGAIRRSTTAARGSRSARGLRGRDGDFWRGEIARHDRRRLAHAIWAVLARRLLKSATRYVLTLPLSPAMAPQLATC